MDQGAQDARSFGELKVSSLHAELNQQQQQNADRLSGLTCDAGGCTNAWTKS